MDQSNEHNGRPRISPAAAALPGALADAPLVMHARFRGVVFDVDPVFANSEEWYDSIPIALRPDRDQPFYHLLADNGEQSYIAYVSQQNLAADNGTEPIDHPAIAMLFQQLPDGAYRLDAQHWH
jgi:heat shock protein HspQ